MKNAFRNIISVTLTVLVLFSTLSFTVSKHYCGSFLVDSAIFISAKTCGMEVAYRPSSSSETMVQKASCCKDELLSIRGQDELKNSFDTLSFETAVFIHTFDTAYSEFLKPIASDRIFHSEYSPPVLVRNFPQWYGAFLI